MLRIVDRPPTEELNGRPEVSPHDRAGDFPLGKCITLYLSGENTRDAESGTASPVKSRY